MSFTSLLFGQQAEMYQNAKKARQGAQAVIEQEISEKETDLALSTNLTMALNTQQFGLALIHTHALMVQDRRELATSCEKLNHLQSNLIDEQLPQNGTAGRAITRMAAKYGII